MIKRFFLMKSTGQRGTWALRNQAADKEPEKPKDGLPHLNQRGNHQFLKNKGKEITGEGGKNQTKQKKVERFPVCL